MAIGPAIGPIGALAIRTMPARLHRNLAAVAGFVDAVQAAPTASLQAMAVEIDRLAAGDRVEAPALAALQPLIATGLPVGVPRRLVTAALADRAGVSFASFAELLEHCHAAFDPVGQMLLHAFGRATGDRVVLSDRICTGLAVLGYCGQVGADYRQHRIHLPAEDLDRFDVTPDDFGAPVASPAMRALVAFETTRALAWVDAGAPLVSTLRGWPRLVASSYVARARALAADLRRSGHDPLAAAPSIRPGQTALWWLRATTRWAG